MSLYNLIYSPSAEKLYLYIVISRWTTTSHTSVAFWKNMSVRRPSICKRPSSCGKSFTISDNNRVNCGTFFPSAKSLSFMTWHWSSNPSRQTNICVWDLEWHPPAFTDDLGAASSLMLPLILTFVFDGGKVALKSPSSPYSSSSGLRSNAAAMGRVVSVLAPDWHGQTSTSTHWHRHWSLPS